MTEPPHKRARLNAPDGFTKSKPKQPVARPAAAFQSDFVQPAPPTSINKPILYDAAIRAAAKPISAVKAKDVPLKAPQPLHAPEFGQKATPHTPPADFTSRARAFKLAEASGSGSSSIINRLLTTRPNVRSPLDPPLRRAPKAQTPHLHLDSPLTPIGETPRTASPAERRALPPPAPPRAASPTPNRGLVPPKPPETPARKPMSKPVSAAKLLASRGRP
ncbi:hypothetical protein PENSPDRAFT_42229 [Peniophora sp. CONT]|nr:hypothetical protein PENSPDRAFT_42229 [Peniophora sp. CONT]